ATVKDGSRLLSGTVSAVPPNPRVVIRVIDDVTAVGSTPAAPGQGPVELGPPRGTPPNNNPLPPINARLPDPAGNPLTSHNSPPANIPNQVVPLAPDTPSAPNVSIPRTAPGSVPEPAPVPSCFFNGQKLDNFALNDLDGGTWEFRQHRGRLVLLDFWY